VLAAGTVAALPSFYDVGATTPHAGPVAWAARTVMERSVRARARGVVIPPGVDLRDPALAARAIGHYAAACRTCHGAPGVKPDPWVVTYPAAPDLTRRDVVSAWSDTELHWIIKNGIKDTGMMALGPTHEDRDIWAVTAFVRQLPETSPERYAQLIEQRGASMGKHDH
jgi:mono/diheme cytochrome c family protein